MNLKAIAQTNGIGERMQLLLDALKLKHTHLGAGSDVSENTARSWCNGSSSPNAERLPSIAETLKGDRSTGETALYILGIEG